MNRQRLGALIRARRIHLELSIVEVCKLTRGEVLPGYISQLELGKGKHRLNLNMILKVANALELDSNLIKLIIGDINKHEREGAVMALEKILLEVRNELGEIRLC